MPHITVPKALDAGIERVLDKQPSSQVFYAQDGSAAIILNVDASYGIFVDERGRYYGAAVGRAEVLEVIE